MHFYKNILMLSSQEMNESLDTAVDLEQKNKKQLKQLSDAVSKLGYAIQCNVPYNGNCYFHAVSIHTGVYSRFSNLGNSGEALN